ncbi:hypothetical protein OK18_19175 [Chryseobacterium gallinarum]|uniref:Uncharacterized protein n=1 Tax=Chryseobacterium gallinarum TaxID=1324352 RepID=A0A0G3M6C0_CHRGL|nr:hypothetical protein [Chryseobacterium gallinarum]AKK74454.1 hypothetical protein OK18_19175 [Chryseobacterium gallinarum]
MKKLFFLLLSCIAFGQNIELLKKIHHGDKTLPDLVANELFPGYKLVGNYKAEPTVFYEYLPDTSTENDLIEYHKNGAIDKRIETTFQDYDTTYVFRSIKANCNIILSLWKKEINPKQEYEDIRLGFTYENKENKIYYYFTHNGENTCSITNKKLFIE